MVKTWKKMGDAATLRVQKSEEMDQRYLSFSFRLSHRLAPTVKSRLGIINTTRFTSLLKHVRYDEFIE